MTDHRVHFAPSAHEHVATIDRWWSENRPSAPGLFADEIADAVARLRVHPQSGALYRRPGKRDRRRLLLQRTRYHVYYVIDEPAEAVTIEAVWHRARGARPRLR